ncbi:MAG: LacI family DNA-binding transcriptional regulator [Sphaerochaetaceae bacterium]|jgi:LacI family transcriptional regulator
MTLKDVAKRANCSIATVSLAINNRPGVSPKTRERILGIAKEMGYAPNSIARSLALNKTSTLGLLITDIENPFFGNLVHHISIAARKKDYSLIISTSDDEFSKENEALGVFLNRKVDGVIVVPTQRIPTDYSMFHILKTNNVPLLFSVSYYPEIETDRVLTDYTKGSYQLTRYLLNLGHKEILFLTGADINAPINKDRVEGYKNAYDEAHIPFNMANIITCNQPTFFEGYRAVTNLLKQKALPDAIIGINDVLALGAKKAAEELKLSVPQDISIAGYDDVIYASLLEKPLTTVKQDIKEIADKSVDFLIQRIKHPQKPFEQILIQPELIVRDTTGVKR